MTTYENRPISLLDFLLNHKLSKNLTHTIEITNLEKNPHLDIQALWNLRCDPPETEDIVIKIIDFLRICQQVVFLFTKAVCLQDELKLMRIMIHKEL